MPLTLIALSKVDDNHAGLTSSLVSTGQVADGSIGLAIGSTVLDRRRQHRPESGERGLGRHSGSRPGGAPAIRDGGAGSRWPGLARRSNRAHADVRTLPARIYLCTA
jgi:hypothetical protein